MTLYINPKLHLEGRSGCKIDIINHNNSFYVRKVSSSFSYNERLETQEKMQNHFNNIYQSDIFSSPVIVNSGYLENGLYYFDMEYSLGEKFSDYFSKISLDDLNLFYKNIINYFDLNFKNSKEELLSFDIIKEKIEDITNKTSNMESSFINLIENYLYKNFPNSPIPIGYCHGDFTFSNILIKSNNEIILLDFLDSFIKSPLIDIVKIQQDTKYYWSVYIDKSLQQHKKVRSIQVLNNLNFKIDKYIDQYYSNYKQWIKFLEVLNLFRILPYINEKNDYIFLKNNLIKAVSL